MENKIQVSVCCLTYNHEKSIRKTLEGFVKQKTNFLFEVFVHDDASSDNTVNIIKEYEERYPDIIKGIYESENQYSKGVLISRDIIKPLLNGRYLAMCEGDDYWSDSNKLQIQYDYMENHKECSMCVHNTVVHDLRMIEKDRLFNNWNSIHELTAEEIFSEWKVHLTSFFMKKEYFHLYELRQWYWFGDYVILTTCYSKGKIVCLPNVMSVYNYGNNAGITQLHINSDIDSYVNKANKRIEYLCEYNEKTQYIYNNEIEMAKLKYSFEICYDEYKYYVKNNVSGVRSKYKALLSHPYLSHHLAKCNLPKRFLKCIKYYVFYGALSVFKDILNK